MSSDHSPISMLPPEMRIRLAELSPRLAPYAKAACKPAPNYRALHIAILNGQIEAERVGREWNVRSDSLGEIAVKLGLASTGGLAPVERSALAAPVAA